MKQNKERPGVMIYFHIFEMLKLLDTQQVGEVMLALMAYAKDGIEPQFREQVMQIVWVNMKNAADTDLVHYEEKRAQAKAASAKRWGKDADASDRMRTVPINNNNHKYTNRYTNKSKCRCNYKSICICTNTIKNRRGYRPEGSRLWGAASARSADTVSRQETKTFPAFPAAVWRKGREGATITLSGLSTFSQEVPL